MRRERVLVVDDDRPILTTVSAGLTARNFEVVTAPDGAAALDAIERGRVDVLVLDLGLPDMDGIDVVKAVRASTAVPIIVLSADGSEARKVLALELGADDYVTKPFSMAELVARVRVALRHRSEMVADEARRVLVAGDLQIDLVEHVVTLAGRTIELTPKEFALLVALTRRPGRLMPYGLLLGEVWGPEYRTETHYLRVYVSHIRKKLGTDGRVPDIRVEPGVGYRLVLPLESG